VAREVLTCTGVGGEPLDGANGGLLVEPVVGEAPPPGGTPERGGLSVPARTTRGIGLLGAGAEVFIAEEDEPLGLRKAASSAPTAVATALLVVDSEAFVSMATIATVSDGSEYSTPSKDALTAAAIKSAALNPSSPHWRDGTPRPSTAINSSNNESVSLASDCSDVLPSCFSRDIAQSLRKVLDNELIVT
jgi:hypothetical protein